MCASVEGEVLVSSPLSVIRNKSVKLSSARHL